MHTEMERRISASAAGEGAAVASLGLTAGLARFVAHTPQVPKEALLVARDGITDAVGLLVAARAEPVVQHVLAHALQGGASGPSSLLLSARTTRAREAAMVNAVAAHAFAMDDVAWGCHPSAVLMPTLLAVGEDVGASGADLLRAWVIGYEVIAELASRESQAWHSTGWHPTGLIAPVAAAAAAAHLMGLDAGQAQHALGIAASLGGGLSVNFGTQTKALHAGRAASAGVEAAQLAARGLTSSPQALEAPNGLLHTVSPGKTVDLTTPFDAACPPWRVVACGISLKKYPLCYSVHRIADAAIEMAQRPGFSADRVRAIDVWVGRRQAAMAHHRMPGTALEARYSVPFAVAAGLLARSAGFAQLEPEFFLSEGVERMIAATRIHLVDAVSADDPVFAPADRLRVEMEDGAVLDSGEVRFARGHARSPMAPAQARQKFMDCTAALGAERADALFSTLQGLAEVADVRTLAGLVHAGTTEGGTA